MKQKLIKLVCCVCLKNFERKLSLHNRSSTRSGEKYQPTCSHKCSTINQTKHKNISIKCTECNCEFYRSTKYTNNKINIFCSRSCSAKYYNKQKPKKINPKTTTESTTFCELCNETIFLKKRKTNGYFMKRFCDTCKFNQPHNVINKTKGELFANMANWQSARSCIQKNARKVFYKSGLKKECCKCGYDKHFEICHIKDVASFESEALISEINDIKNLIALCPNHHWELDNGLLSIEKLGAVPGLEPGLPAY